ncbi:hypothetical protein ACF0H5_000231 [Mactra antiquata]
MEPKKARRRIIDNSCVPISRRNSSRSSGRSNSCGKADHFDLSPESKSGDTKSFTDAVIIEDSVQNSFTDIANLRKMSTQNGLNLEAPIDKLKEETIVNPERKKIHSIVTREAETGVYGVIYEKKVQSEPPCDFDKEFLNKANVPTGDLDIEVSVEHRNYGDIEADQEPDALSFLDSTLADLDDSKIHELDDLAEIKNEDLLTDLGLNSDKEMCNNFKSLFKRRVSTNSLDVIQTIDRDTIICRKHIGLFDEKTRDSVDNFQFSLDLKSDISTIGPLKIETNTASPIEESFDVSEMYTENETIERKDPFLVELELTKSASLESETEIVKDLHEKDLFRKNTSSPIQDRIKVALDKLDKMIEGEDENEVSDTIVY